MNAKFFSAIILYCLLYASHFSANAEKSFNKSSFKFEKKLITATNESKTLISSILYPFNDPLLSTPKNFSLKYDKAIFSGDLSDNFFCLDGDGDQALVSRELTLEVAIDTALCNNPQIKISWAGIKAQSASRGEVRASYFPTVALSINSARTRQTIPSPLINSPANYQKITNTSAYANFNWRLIDFGVRSANLLAANASLNAALVNLDSTVQRVISSVIQYYTEAQIDFEILKLVEKNEEHFNQIFISTQRKKIRGVNNISDVLQAEIALTRAQLDKNQAQSSYKKSLAALLYAIGKSQNAVVMLNRFDFSKPSKLNAPDSSLGFWIDEARINNPVLISARYQLLVAKAKTASAISEGLPSLDFSISAYKNGRPNQTISYSSSRENVVNLTFNVPIFDGFSKTYKVRGAQALVDQKFFEIEETENQLLSEVAKNHSDLMLASNNLDSASNLLSSTASALNSIQRLFENGSVGVIDLLNAQTALINSEVQRVKAFGEVKISRIKLLTTSGTVTNNLPWIIN